MSKPRIINQLAIAIVQTQDADNASSTLIDADYYVTRLSSTGGFLGRGNVTLLIGFAKGQESTLIEILAKTCRRRVEYVSTPLEGAPFSLQLPTPITVGGATMFLLPVERYEEIP